MLASMLHIDVTIIIPVRRINEYINESILSILNLDYDHFEVLILPDDGDLSQIEVPPEKLSGKVSIVPIGPLGPAKKRDIGAKIAKGEILAFLDDDAYPRKDWITNAIRHFKKPEIAAVGGPAVTPQDDSFWQRVSGAVYLSPLGGGSSDRYWPGKRCYFIDDWPSVNLFVRKHDFKQAGGFNSQYWPGEDTKLCLDLTHRLNKKIIYDPDVFVWHHRREGLLRHLRQVGRYGLHRGFFAKKLPKTSRRVKYFTPTLLVTFIIVGLPLSFLSNLTLNSLYYTGIGLYLFALGIAFFQIKNKEKNLAISLMSLPYIFLSHLWYAVRFFQGFLLIRDLKSKLRTTK